MKENAFLNKTEGNLAAIVHLIWKMNIYLIYKINKLTQLEIQLYSTNQFRLKSMWHNVGNSFHLRNAAYFKAKQDIHWEKFYFGTYPQSSIHNRHKSLTLNYTKK